MILRRAALALFIVALALMPVLVPPNQEFWITQANYIGLYSLVVLGIVLLTGITGLISFGQAAFVGMGAYTAAYLSVTHGISPWLTVWIGLAITGLAALVLAFITLRMSGHYLPLATIAWGLSLFYLLGNIDALGKYDGLLGVPPIDFFGIALNTGRTFFYLVWAIVVLAAVAVTHLLDSRTGRALRAVRGGTTMAEAMGVDTFRVKVTAFVLAALLASVSGWLFAHFQRTVNPSPFGLNMGIEYLFMAVLGGVGYVWGAIAGAGIVQILKDQLQVWLPKLMGTSGNYEIIVFGILLVLVLQYARDGLWAFVEAALPRVRRKVDWGDAEPLPDAAAAAPRRDRARRRCRAQDLRRPGRRERRQLRGAGRRDPRPDRPERRRQVDHLQPRHRRAAGHVGPGDAARPPHRFDALAPHRPARRLAHLPAREDDRRHDGAGERRARRAPARPPRRAVGDAAARSRRRSAG